MRLVLPTARGTIIIARRCRALRGWLEYVSCLYCGFGVQIIICGLGHRPSRHVAKTIAAGAGNRSHIPNLLVRLQSLAAGHDVHHEHEQR